MMVPSSRSTKKFHSQQRKMESFPVITGKLFSLSAQTKDDFTNYVIGVIQHDKENEKRRRHKAKRQAQTEAQDIRFCQRAEWIPLEIHRQSFTGWLFYL